MMTDQTHEHKPTPPPGCPRFPSTPRVEVIQTAHIDTMGGDPVYVWQDFAEVIISERHPALGFYGVYAVVTPQTRCDEPGEVVLLCDDGDGGLEEIEPDDDLGYHDVATMFLEIVEQD